MADDPPPAIGIVRLDPARWFDQPIIRRFPVEVLAAASAEGIGVDVTEISTIRLAATLDPDDPQRVPLFGYQFDAPEIDVPRVITMTGGRPDPQPDGEGDGDDGAVSVIDDRADIILRIGDGRSGYIGHRQFRDRAEATGGGNAKLRVIETDWSNADRLPRGVDPHVFAAVDIEPLRPLIEPAIDDVRRSLAYSLRPLADLPSLVETVQALLAFDGTTADARLILTAAGEDEAARVRQILENTLASAVRRIADEILASMEMDGAVGLIEQSARQYADRTAAWIIENLRISRDGRDVTIEVRGDVGVASTIALAGMVGPNIAKEMARMQPPNLSNNMKQIGLALHNYHSAFRRMPGPAITGDDGKRLLSWRVAILPFIEEQDLWEEFHHDEPWDSEHNLPLADRMPDVFRVGSVRVPPNHTVIQACVGEGLMMQPEGVTTFRNVLDGLSNTVWVVQTDAERAVPWTKPVDIEFDLDQPLQGLGNALGPGAGFYALWGDGAVRRVSANVDAKMFRKALTRAGREVIQGDWWTP